METWYFAKCDARYSSSATLELIYSFIVNFSKLASGYGVFSISDTDTGTVTFYFSPEAQMLAESFSFVTTQCAKPNLEGLRLELVDENSWKHFADVG